MVKKKEAACVAREFQFEAIGKGLDKKVFSTLSDNQQTKALNKVSVILKNTGCNTLECASYVNTLPKHIQRRVYEAFSYLDTLKLFDHNKLFDSPRGYFKLKQKGNNYEED